MSYLDDLREYTYTSPSGSVHRVEFDDLNRGVDPKVAVMEPPQQSRAEVQNLGSGGIRIPMNFYVSGMDYNVRADALFEALMEPTDSRRPGTLQHPRWGDILVSVVSGPFQAERFVEGMGQATFTGEFIRIDRETKFPGTSTDAGGQLQADADAAADQSAAGYTANGAPGTPGETVAVTAGSTNFLTATGDALRGMASSADDLGSQFEADLATALASVDALVADPADLASSVMALVRAPAVAALTVGDKIRSYQTLMTSSASLTTNTYAECELMLLTLGAVSVGACEASLSGDLGNRGAAVDASDLIDQILTQLREAIEAAELTGWRPDGDTVAALETALSTARARLLSSSFDLKTERRKPLPSAMDPNTAVKTLYGTWSEDTLDQFIKDNDLADDEFFGIPAGREVVWYA